MNHQEWLEERRKGIGGSDAAAIVGLNPYASPYTVWADKMGRLPEKEDNEAMRQGRDLEGYVAERWMEVTGKKCRRRTKMLRHPDYPYAHANVDRWVVGENAGLECKTTSIMNLKKFKNGEYPDTYYTQCVHYMAVTGADRWYLGVLILNQGFYTFVIERDEEEIDALMQAEKGFWKYVSEDTPPPVDGEEATTETINTIYNQPTKESLDLFDSGAVIKSYLRLKEQITNLSKEKEVLEQTLKESLKDFETGFWEDYQVKWKPQQRRTFQVKEFIKDHPKIKVDPYYKKTTFRKFEIKERK